MRRWKQILQLVPNPTISGLIVLMAAIFLVQDLAGLQWAIDFGMIPAEVDTAWRAARNGQFNGESGFAFGTILFAVFLHGGLSHVSSNMLYFWVFGSLVAGHLGRWRVLVAFLVAGICGNVMQVVLEPKLGVPVIGASGGVSGLEGLYFGLTFLWRLRWPDVWPLAHPIPPGQLAVFAGLGAMFDIYGVVQRGAGIAYGAHVGGFLSGLLIAGLVTQFYPTESAYRERNSRIARHDG